MKSAQMFILFLAVTAFNAFAQDDVPEGILTSTERLELIGGHIISFGSPQKDVLQIEQIGNNNQITAIQQLTQTGSYVFQTLQNGNDNVGYTYQSGAGHELILNQNGNHNEANLRSLGSNTQNFVQQKGSDNFVNSFVENTSIVSLTATSVQIGDNNRINLQLPDINPVDALKEIYILQTGPGNSADVMLNYFDSPYLEVEQTGGSKISITHTQFNFPTK
jgi:hypothetical protein